MTSYHHSQMTNYTQVCTRVSWLLATHVQLLHISIIITCRQCTVTIAHMPVSAAARPPWFTSSAQQTHCECKHRLASLTQTDSLYDRVCIKLLTDSRCVLSSTCRAVFSKRHKKVDYHNELKLLQKLTTRCLLEVFTVCKCHPAETCATDKSSFQNGALKYQILAKKCVKSNYLRQEARFFGFCMCLWAGN